ncbi:MAG: hypothetical protein KDD34_08745 [Bdellovibrionales bacterium]|nr:hypothetical protein [Bdellovibrionales bacterium]
MKFVTTVFLFLMFAQVSVADTFEVAVTDSLGYEWSKEVGVYSNGCLSPDGRFSKLYCGIRKPDFRIYTEPETSDATRVCEEMGAMLPTKYEFINLISSRITTSNGEKTIFETEKNSRGNTVLTLDGRVAFEQIFGDNDGFWTSTVGRDISRTEDAAAFMYGSIVDSVQRNRELSVICIRPKANN